jgi:hypothetical protein
MNLVGGFWVLEEDVVAADVDERPLGNSGRVAPVVDVGKVGLEECKSGLEHVPSPKRSLPRSRRASIQPPLISPTSAKSRQTASHRRGSRAGADRMAMGGPCIP